MEYVVMDQGSDDEAARDLAPQEDRRQDGPEEEEPASLALPVQPALHSHRQISHKRPGYVSV